jgi:hypothetical protein
MSVFSVHMPHCVFVTSMCDSSCCWAQDTLNLSVIRTSVNMTRVVSLLPVCVTISVHDTDRVFVTSMRDSSFCWAQDTLLEDQKRAQTESRNLESWSTAESLSGGGSKDVHQTVPPPSEDEPGSRPNRALTTTGPRPPLPPPSKLGSSVDAIPVRVQSLPRCVLFFVWWSWVAGVLFFAYFVYLFACFVVVVVSVVACRCGRCFSCC